LTRVERRQPASVELAHQLIEYLLSGAIPPGGKIPSERALSETLDVGRSAVREALKSLTLLGLIDVRQGDGTYLAASSSDLLPRIIEWGLMLGERRVQDLTEARAEVEVILAGMAAKRRTPEGLEELRAIVDEMKAADEDLDRYIAADVQFHLKIAELSGNTALAGVLNSIRTLLQVWTNRVIMAVSETRSSLAVHLPIFEAIEEGDAEAARAAMFAHMRSANRNLANTIGK
jgi:GntR family transcriptional repressor for pyruvate dehydrogenase complex